MTQSHVQDSYIVQDFIQWKAAVSRRTNAHVDPLIKKMFRVTRVESITAPSC